MLSAAARVACRVEQRVRALLAAERTVYVEERLAEYRGYWERAASILGATLVELTPGIWEIRLGGRRTRVAGYVAGNDASTTRRVAGDKLLCYRLAREVGVPVPSHRAFHRSQIPALAEGVAAEPATYAVKPLRDTASGLGITLGVTTPRQARRAATLASLYSAEILLERLVPGESYRLLYLDGRLLHAVRRRGVRVEGDGVRTVSELLHAAHGRAVRIGESERQTLRLQAHGPDSVPAPRRSILVRGLPAGATRREQRTIYDEDATALVSPALDAELRRVVRAVGSSFAGVDVVTVDPTLPLRESGGAFLEINTTPGIHHHYLSDDDRRSGRVAVAVLRSLLHPPGPAATEPPVPTNPRGASMIPAKNLVAGSLHTADYLREIGVPAIAPATSPFDPGYDPVTVESHLEQSRHLISTLKVSMACWMVADESATRRKVAAAKRLGVRTTTGGGPFEVAVQQRRLEAYLDLCADIGFDRIECGEGFTDLELGPTEVLAMIHERGMEAQFELGKKHGGAFTDDVVQGLIDQGRAWLDAGAVQLVVEGRESAKGVGLFDDEGNFNGAFADRFARAFGLETVIFEAPNKPSQFALLDHFGREVHLCNVRLEELLRVEIYRRGLHSDAFEKPNLRPRLPLEIPIFAHRDA